MARKAAAVGGPSPKMPAPPKAKGPAPAKAAAKDTAILSDGETRGPKTKPLGGTKPALPMGGGMGNPLAALGAALGGAKPPGAAPPMGGMSKPARPRAAGLAIGQRPQLGARTKTAMKKGR
jgi:hypothetical protein